jgi:hypothetical protein
MAIVLLNGKCVMMGNFWDFHPGSHNITEYGDFNSHKELVQAIEKTLKELGEEVSILITIESNWENW